MSSQTGDDRPREDAADLLDQRLRRVERGERRRGRRVQIHAAVLLRGSRDGGDPGHAPAPTARALPSRDRAPPPTSAAARRQRAGRPTAGCRARAVRRKVAIEIRRVLEHQTRRVRVDVNRLQRQMLRAGVETEIQGRHDLARPRSFLDVSQRLGCRLMIPTARACSTPDTRHASKRRRVRAVPGVARAPLELDLGEPVTNDAVAAREDRPIRADLVEARPDRRRRWDRRRRRRRTRLRRTDRDADRRACREVGPAEATPRRRRSTQSSRHRASRSASETARRRPSRDSRSTGARTRAPAAGASVVSSCCWHQPVSV